MDGEEYRINTDFRISIRYELLALDTALDAQEKLIRALELYYPIIPANTKEAVESLFWFYRCGERGMEEGGSGGGRGGERIYSYEYDGAYIYAAFMQQYGLDLCAVQYMHWWRFRALFEGLGEACRICKIMEYRAMEIPPNMDKERKEFYARMKEAYKLPRQRGERERMEKIEEALLNGGDLTGLL